jgi:hypothetical protein
LLPDEGNWIKIRRFASERFEIQSEGDHFAGWCDVALIPGIPAVSPEPPFICA